MSYKIHQAKKSLWQFIGLTRRRWKNLNPGLYCFNYHRIGDPSATELDPNVYSCTADNLNAHLKEIRNNFDLVNSSELSLALKSPQGNKSRYALITFDDGYRDNLTEALPVLEENEVSAIFFLCELTLSTPNHIQWWDEIAWIISNSQTNTFKLATKTLDLRSIRTRREQVRYVLNCCKNHPELSVLECLDELRQQTGIRYDSLPDRPKLFIDWEDASRLLQAGMEVGSHTLTHRILAQLSLEEQLQELAKSKAALESGLECDVNTVAYPVGTSDSYNKDTHKAAEIAGYQLGFNNMPGMNSFPLEARYDLCRFSIDNNPSTERLFADVCLPYRAPVRYPGR